MTAKMPNLSLEHASMQQDRTHSGPEWRRLGFKNKNQWKNFNRNLARKSKKNKIIDDHAAWYNNDIAVNTNNILEKSTYIPFYHQNRPVNKTVARLKKSKPLHKNPSPMVQNPQ